MYKQLKGFLDSFLYKLVFSDRLSGCLVPLKSADKDNGWSGRSAGWSIVTLTQEHGFDSRFYWNGSQKRRALRLPQTVEISKMPTKRTIWGQMGRNDYIRFENWVYAFQRKIIRYYKTCVGRAGYKIVYKL